MIINIHMCVLCVVTQLCPTHCDPMDGNPQDILSMGILQARILEWVAMPSSRGSSQPRDCTQVSCIAGGLFPIRATREALNILLKTFGISWISLEHMLVDTGYWFYFRNRITFSSVQFSCSVVSESLRPHELQHARPPCPSPTPRVHSNSCPSSQWCLPAISSSVVPFFCPQSLPASGSFPMSQLFTWGGQSTGVSALACYSVKQQVTLRNMILLKMLASSYFQMIAHMGNPRESISYEN